jgi:hypothetical protein
VSVTVVTTPEADEQIHVIDSWWRANRSAAPDLFTEELANCFNLLVSGLAELAPVLRIPPSPPYK